MANASHELRSPLSAIKALVEGMLAVPLQNPEFYREYLLDINKQVDRLAKLINDLLVLSRLENRSLDWQPQKVNFFETVRMVTLRLHTQFRERDLKAVNSIEKNLFVLGQERLLERLVYNLLENAVKYNKEGGEICLSLYAREDTLVLEISDTRLGIPEHLQPLVWQRFFRVDPARSRELGGTGLGLALVKQIADLYQARIALKSEEGKGTTISVFFPLFTKYKS